jgi:Type IX secretion system protein PorV
MKQSTMKKITTLASLLLFVQFLQAQTVIVRESGTPSPVMAGIGLPFSDARHAALGDAGVATSPDYADIFYNPAKTAFAETRYGFYSSGNKWLNNLVSDMYLIRAGVNYKLPDNNSAISVNFTYFNQGAFQATSSTGQTLGNFNSYDWALGANYAKKLSPKLSLGVGLKYVKSVLFSGTIGGFQGNPAETIAADISIFHQSNDSTKLVNLNYGIYISNLSGRVSYGGTELNFIPTNLKIGIAPTIKISKNSTFTLALDANKLMIPTPTYDINGKQIPTKTAIGGILGSFSDAPGGFNEELQEIIWSIGGEFWFNKTFAIRVGKFIESEKKGGRNLTTFGLGAKIFKKINVDLAYLHNQSNDSPLSNLWRANVTFGLGK